MMKNCWLQITSGRGPAECAFVVYNLLPVILQELKNLQMESKELELIPGAEKRTLLSALLSIQGNNLNEFRSSWEGSIQWIGTSPFRPGHKRKNWFAGVHFLEEPATLEWNQNEFHIESMRASGAGGQHVNKTESAIRITHLPTNISVIAREERSQHMNKKLAMARMEQALKDETSHVLENDKMARWGNHNNLIRGNPTRIYEGLKFRRIT